jgi:hypothetical protein
MPGFFDGKALFAELGALLLRARDDAEWSVLKERL